MKTNRRGTMRDRARQGAAMATVLVLILTMSSVAAIMSTVSRQRSAKAWRLADRARALAIAEAGAHFAYSVMATNFNISTNAVVFDERTYDGGTFDPEIVRVDTNSAAIHSTGTFRGMRTEVILDVRRENTGGGSGVTPGQGAYGYNIVADGEITWTGCGVFQGGGIVHANGEFVQSGCGELNADCYSCVKMTLNGNSGFIDGDVHAPVVKGKTGKIRGTVYKQAVAQVEIPDIDLTPYYNQALANGEVHDGRMTISHGYTPVGGVCWINGDLFASGPDDVTGCFIATGDIHLSGGGRHNKVSRFPALISRDGDIKISGSAEYHGLIYARTGDVEITGGCSVHGSILCGGDFTKHGCSTILAYEECTPIPPGVTGSPGDDIVFVTAWQK